MPPLTGARPPMGNPGSTTEMCSLVQVALCVYCLVAGDELTLSVLHDLTLQVNLFSRKVIYWLPQFTQKYNGMFISILSGRCDRFKCEC